LWLESDRMEALNISNKSLSVQKKVVIEEFKQNYLNQPYGDVSLLMKPLVYTQHPYSWSTIGKEISHIEKTTVKDIQQFFQNYYHPDNAILVLAGDIQMQEARLLVEKYFLHIPNAHTPLRSIPAEPEQTQARHLDVKRNVPHNTLYKTYHICPRMHPDFYAFDLLSDILSNGKSSRFYIELVKNKRIFTDINAFVSGDIEAGTFMINGTLSAGVSMEMADASIVEMIEEIKRQPIGEQELEKVKNKLETSLIFSNMKALDKAMNLAYFELMGGAALLNEEDRKYRQVDISHLQRVSKQYLYPENCSTMYYYAEKTK
ncbi:MAG: pitrilysin family protein, partial [Bacteroidales bacterium]